MISIPKYGRRLLSCVNTSIEADSWYWLYSKANPKKKYSQNAIIVPMKKIIPIASSKMPII